MKITQQEYNLHILPSRPYHVEKPRYADWLKCHFTVVIYRGIAQKISFSIGPDLAVLMMYSLSTLLLLAVFGVPKLKTIPKFYLLSAAALFLVYEICFAYAVALAQTAQQAIEISLVNYLWPSMTIAMLILFHELKFHSLVVVGLSISLAGIFISRRATEIFI